MRRHSLRSVSILSIAALSVLGIFFACKRHIDVDFPSKELSVSAASFFRTDANTPTQIQSIVRDLQKNKKLTASLEDFIKKNGVPVWNKAAFSSTQGLSNGQSRTSARTSQSSGSSSLGLYLIPLESASDSTVQSFIACKQSADSTFAYSLYNKNSLIHSTPSTDSVKQKTLTHLAIINYFDHVINHRDSLKVEGFANETIKGATITMSAPKGGDVSGAAKAIKPNKAGLRDDDPGVWLCEVEIDINVSYSVTTVTLGGEIISQTVVIQDETAVYLHCYQYGSGGGGGSGKNTVSDPYSVNYNPFDPSYTPQLDPTNFAYDPLYDPAHPDAPQPTNFPIYPMGWFNFQLGYPSSGVFDPATTYPFFNTNVADTYPITQDDYRKIADLELEENQAYNEATTSCKGTFRTGNVFFQGTLEHWLIQADYLDHTPGAVREYQIPNAGFTSYADLCWPIPNWLFEIKPDNPNGRASGQSEIANYVTAATSSCGRGQYFAGTDYTTRYLFWPRDRNSSLKASLYAPGVIVYSLENANQFPPDAVIVDSNIMDAIRALFRRLKANASNRLYEMQVFLQQNPRAKAFLKGAAYGIIIGTLIEDVLTFGNGVADDAQCFLWARELLFLAKD